jgi:hypothetical protein
LVILALYFLRFKMPEFCSVQGKTLLILAESRFMHPEEPDAEARRGRGFFGSFAGGCGRISQGS